MGDKSLPFSEDELYQVFRLLVDSEADARAMARGALSKPPPFPSHDLPSRGGGSHQGLEFESEPHVQLTEDTLILLSLLSDDLRVRVERYRGAQRRGATPTPGEEMEWEARRAELKRWMLERAEGDRR